MEIRPIHIELFKEILGKRLMGFTPYGFLESRIKDTNPRAGNHMRHLWGSMRTRTTWCRRGWQVTWVLAKSEKAVVGPEPLPPSWFGRWSGKRTALPSHWPWFESLFSQAGQYHIGAFLSLSPFDFLCNGNSGVPVPGGYSYGKRQQRGPTTELGMDRVQNWLCTPQYAPSSTGSCFGQRPQSVVHTSVWASEVVRCLLWWSSSAKVLKKSYALVRGWQWCRRWYFLLFLTKQLSCCSEIVANPLPFSLCHLLSPQGWHLKNAIHKPMTVILPKGKHFPWFGYRPWSG